MKYLINLKVVNDSNELQYSAYLTFRILPSEGDTVQFQEGKLLKVKKRILLSQEYSKFDAELTCHETN